MTLFPIAAFIPRIFHVSLRAVRVSFTSVCINKAVAFRSAAVDFVNDFRDSSRPKQEGESPEQRPSPILFDFALIPQRERAAGRSFSDRSASNGAATREMIEPARAILSPQQASRRRFDFDIRNLTQCGVTSNLILSSSLISRLGSS